jgi:DNA-directed RNA polymerase specialized sigma24 family protein
MKEEQREVLYLICVKRLPYEETAEILGVSINTVANRLALARLALHEGLSKIRAGADGNVRQTRNTGR